MLFQNGEEDRPLGLSLPPFFFFRATFSRGRIPPLRKNLRASLSTLSKHEARIFETIQKSVPLFHNCRIEHIELLAIDLLGKSLPDDDDELVRFFFRSTRLQISRLRWYVSFISIFIALMLNKFYHKAVYIATSSLKTYSHLAVPTSHTPTSFIS